MQAACVYITGTSPAFCFKEATKLKMMVKRASQAHIGCVQIMKIYNSDRWHKQQILILRRYVPENYFKMQISTLKYILLLQFEEMTFYSSNWSYGSCHSSKHKQVIGESLEQEHQQYIAQFSL